MDDFVFCGEICRTHYGNNKPSVQIKYKPATEYLPKLKPKQPTLINAVIESTKQMPIKKSPKSPKPRLPSIQSQSSLVDLIQLSELS